MSDKNGYADKPPAMYAPPSLTNKSQESSNSQESRLPANSNAGYYSNVTAKGKLILPTALWVLLIIAGLCFLSLLTTLNKTLGTLDTLVELEQANAKLNKQHEHHKNHKHPLSSQDNLLSEGSDSHKSIFSLPSWASLDPPHKRPKSPFDDLFQSTGSNPDTRTGETSVIIKSDSMEPSELDSIFDQLFGGLHKSLKHKPAKEDDSTGSLLPSISANIDKINVNINLEQESRKGKKKPKIHELDNAPMRRQHPFFFERPVGPLNGFLMGPEPPMFVLDSEPVRPNRKHPRIRPDHEMDHAYLPAFDEPIFHRDNHHQSSVPDPFVITFESELLPPAKKHKEPAPHMSHFDILAVEPPPLGVSRGPSNKGPHPSEEPMRPEASLTNLLTQGFGSKSADVHPAPLAPELGDSIVFINSPEKTKERNQIHDLFTTFFGPPVNSKLTVAPPEIVAPVEAVSNSSETHKEPQPTESPQDASAEIVFVPEKASTTTTTTTTTVVEEKDPKEETLKATTSSPSQDNTQKEMNKFADDLLGIFSLPQFAKQLDPVKVDLEKAAQSSAGDGKLAALQREFGFEQPMNEPPVDHYEDEHIHQHLEEPHFDEEPHMEGLSETDEPDAFQIDKRALFDE